MLEKLKSFCDSFIEAGLPGFDLAVYKDGNCLLRHHNGYSDIENKIKYNGSERYNIYSCSKPITCTAAMQLWEKGLFSLDDKLSDYMSEFECMYVKTDDGVKKANNPILIKHLFEMTAGFSYNTSSPQILKCIEDTQGKCPTREVMKYLAKEPLLFEPGTMWEYSLCHDVLAAFVEVVAKEKFEDYVKKNIFDPCGMKDSTFMLPESEKDGICMQYKFNNGEYDNKGRDIFLYKFGSEYASGGAGCISTVDDYIKFLEALRTGELIKEETLKLMATDRIYDGRKSPYWSQGLNKYYSYGLGLRCHKNGEEECEIGWGGAAGAYLAMDMKNAVSIFLGSNLFLSPVQGMRSAIYHMFKAEYLKEGSIEEVEAELKDLFDYNLTF